MKFLLPICACGCDHPVEQKNLPVPTSTKKNDFPFPVTIDFNNPLVKSTV